MDSGDVKRTASNGFIITVDVGTTTIRCHVYNSKGSIIGSSSKSMTISYPSSGCVEIQPNILWESFVQVVKDAVSHSRISFNEATSFGISTLRGTFLTWNRESGEPYHNFITWQDTRSNDICKSWNTSFRLKAFRSIGSLLHFITRKKKFVAASIFKMTTQMVLPRLLWVLNTNEKLQEDSKTGEALYGTVDTWLIWKLTGGEVHATDPSNACVCGFYDPFQMEWGSWALKMFGIPEMILPQVRDTDGGFGFIRPEIFGEPIPITCVMGDQQAAVFGECCFSVGDVKVTLGTGSFINVNTGNKPYASFKGLYPVIGWKLKGQDPIYLVEGGSSDTGTAVDWLKDVGIVQCPEETSQMALEVISTNGVYFVPAFTGLQAPYNDPTASGGFIGITSSVSKSHLARAVLQSIAFRIKQLYSIVGQEIDLELEKIISINGGVSNNDFVAQAISDLIQIEVRRDKHRQMSSRGVAFICGLATGIWKSTKSLEEFKRIEKTFLPQENNLHEEFIFWEKAVFRFIEWKD